MENVEDVISRYPQLTGIHPAAELIPQMSDAEFEELVKSIKENGFRESDPIHTTVEGKLIDGRHRLLAANACGVQPIFKVFSGDPWAFAVSRNVARRHLSASQRAMIAARLADRGRGRPKINGQICPFNSNEQPMPIDSAAKLLNVSARSIKNAKRIIASGEDTLVRSVELGEMTVHCALDAIATPPPASATNEHDSVLNDITEDEIAGVHGRNWRSKLGIAADDCNWRDAVQEIAKKHPGLQKALGKVGRYRAAFKKMRGEFGNNKFIAEPESYAALDWLVSLFSRAAVARLLELNAEEKQSFFEDSMDEFSTSQLLELRESIEGWVADRENEAPENKEENQSVNEEDDFDYRYAPL